MESKHIQRLLRLLLTLLGAGLGVAVALAVIQLHTWTNPGEALPGVWVVSTYITAALIGALVLFLLSRMIIKKCSEWMAALERYVDRLTIQQIASGTTGLLCGLLIAALVSQILRFMGNSIATTAFSAILYVMLGTTGLSIGARRSEDIGALMGRLPGLRTHHIMKKSRPARPKILDASVLLDGRIVGICHTGFLTGELLVPACVMEELKRMSESTDAAQSLRGKRGLEVIGRLRLEPSVELRIDSDSKAAGKTADSQLLALARRLKASVLTCDSALAKMADIAEVPILNLNELAMALRPSVQTGQEITVTILKAGKEAQQGVAYLEDGTMVVVEGAGRMMGQQATVVVTSALQTSAGRMVFAKLRQA